LQSLALNNPIMVGFGIKDKASFDAVTAHASGAIIGSAFIKALSTSEPIENVVQSFVQQIRS
jgi:tryptophan synthase alpha chain